MKIYVCAKMIFFYMYIILFHELINKLKINIKSVYYIRQITVPYK